MVLIRQYVKKVSYIAYKQAPVKNDKYDALWKLISYFFRNKNQTTFN